MQDEPEDDGLGETTSTDQDDFITTPTVLSFKELYPTDYSYLEPKHRYTEGVAAAIFRQMVAGKSLQQVCDSPGYPSYRDVRVWMEHHPVFKKEIEELQADRVRRSVENMLIDLENEPDELTPYEKNAKQVQFERVKFFAERMLREKFSPTLNHNIQGEVVTRIVVDTGITRDINVIRKMYNIPNDALPASFVKEEVDGTKDKDTVPAKDASSPDPLPDEEVQRSSVPQTFRQDRFSS
jgi:hypothetical protein